jgi:DNA replication licensing factor MCM5
MENPRMLRKLDSELVGQMVVVPGIITSASKSQIKASKLSIRCRNCGDTKNIVVKSGLAGAFTPRVCDRGQQEKCPIDPYYIVPEECDYKDYQTLKIQEAPELVPTGEMPRSFVVSCERNLVDKVTPGMRVTIVGIFSILNSVKGMRDGGSHVEGVGQTVKISYIAAIGIQKQSGENSLGFALPLISDDDKEKITTMAKDPEIYDKIAKSIGGAIYGGDDIKKAIALLLFGGSSKKLPDGMKLRGEINILLLGDPSTAKSQMLKFVERCAPIAIYTSGKGSSAAGLTAAVIKDAATGEFQLEGGAMVLADGGVVCIDEFDKMRTIDRVAIHEAMEQQTISIAKAGITTILNSRTSVLAAANPVMGRYDDLKHAAEQIDFQSAILSRFDCIFIVRDIRDDEKDRKMANHIVSLHAGTGLYEQERAEIDIDLLKKYITYAKTHCAPRLSEESGAILKDFYVKDRADSDSSETTKAHGGRIPITVRQLEAIIRMSESIAKMQMKDVVEREHVEEAHRIFKVSTLHAAKSGISSNFNLPEELKEDVKKVQDVIRRKFAIGSKLSYSKLQEELLRLFNNARSVEYGIYSMIKNQEIKNFENRRILQRIK